MIQTICVAGAGTMGAGIAQTVAQHGFQVILYDLNKTSLIKAEKQITHNLSTLTERGKISSSAAETIRQLVRFESDYMLCKSDLVIEAIVENAVIKNELFRTLCSVNGKDTIYASNTSSLSITALAENHSYPEQVIGLHFFNPATIMKLVELVYTKYNNEFLLEKLTRFARDIGKTVVRCSDSPGFIVNRVARPYYIEALRLAEEGIPIETIDALMESAGFKLGPFRLMDLIGNDVNFAVSNSVYEQLGSPARLKPSIIQQNKVSEGKLGKKTGAGFYNYQA